MLLDFVGTLLALKLLGVAFGFYGLNAFSAGTKVFFSIRRHQLVLISSQPARAMMRHHDQIKMGSVTTLDEPVVETIVSYFSFLARALL